VESPGVFNSVLRGEMLADARSTLKSITSLVAIKPAFTPHD